MKLNEVTASYVMSKWERRAFLRVQQLLIDAGFEVEDIEQDGAHAYDQTTMRFHNDRIRGRAYSSKSRRMWSHGQTVGGHVQIEIQNLIYGLPTYCTYVWSALDGTFEAKTEEEVEQLLGQWAHSKA